LTPFPVQVGDDEAGVAELLPQVESTVPVEGKIFCQ
jgi:hypothetical protein